MTARPGVADPLRAEDERPFILKAFDHALGDEDRLHYARVVEARDPERAEWLRLEVALHARATDDPAVLARFIELSRAIGLDLANLLLRDVILNCGSEGARQGAPRVRFAFACPKRWETLAPTEAASVRFCQHCRERVYYCDTVADAESRALAGQCIAIRKDLSSGGLEGHQLGRPDPVREWADHLFSGGGQASGDHLVVLHAGDAERLGERHPLRASGSAITIGRGADSTIVLPGDGISRSHARFERRGDGWWVIDSGSTNGTYVNGEQVREAPLRRGDRLQFGDAILRFEGRGGR